MSRKNPFDDIERLFDRMNEQFEALEPMEFGAGGQLPVDLVDEGEAFVVVADLAGYDTDDVEVHLPDSHTLRISAERETTTTEDDEHRVVRSERHQSVERSVRLPEEVDEDGTSASFDNGVLTVTLPKATAEDDDSHSIPVN